jgi:hypothetical protein
MNTTISLDERHFKTAVKQARSLGTTPQRYVQSLIDAASQTFDEILKPVRDDFRRSGLTEDQLDEVVSDARKAIAAMPHGKRRK